MATVLLSDLITSVTLPNPCDPLTKLVFGVECIDGSWHVVLIDSENLATWIGIHPNSRQKSTTPCKPCQGITMFVITDSKKRYFAPSGMFVSDIQLACRYQSKTDAESAISNLLGNVSTAEVTVDKQTGQVTLL